MENSEDDYLMISGIQHFKFCRRQWALIHIEQQWKENVKTVEGDHMHEKADDSLIREKRSDKLIVRGMPVRSHQLRITGVCDVVEFISDPEGVWLEEEKDRYKVYPVEYKRGKPKKDDADLLQMAAQAICLEEMLLTNIESGYIFYGETRRRLDVPISESLRKEVSQNVNEMHHLYNRRLTPKVKTGPHCKSCSLQDLCLPDLLNKSSVNSYIERNIFE